MSELHPFVVHFPIVLALVWPIVDGLGLHLGRRDLSHAGLGILIAAALSSVAATVTGQEAFNAAIAAGYKADLLNTHADAANFVPWALFTALFVRSVGVLKWKQRAHYAALLLGIAVWPIIFKSGKSGGALVYDHAVGVARPAGVDARDTAR